MLAENFDEIIEKRRSNRRFDPEVKVPDEVIKRSLERAILSPNSSNMQLWEFYWIKSQEEKEIFFNDLGFFPDEIVQVINKLKSKI